MLLNIGENMLLNTGENMLLNTGENILFNTGRTEYNIYYLILEEQNIIYII